MVKQEESLAAEESNYKQIGLCWEPMTQSVCVMEEDGTHQGLTGPPHGLTAPSALSLHNA